MRLPCQPEKAIGNHLPASDQNNPSVKHEFYLPELNGYALVNSQPRSQGLGTRLVNSRSLHPDGHWWGIFYIFRPGPGSGH